MSERDHEYFRDPVHGFIKVNNLEHRIISSPTFQRLRNIKQLGPTYFAYHGAEHSRFSHSLGTMHIASQMVNYLGQNSREHVNDDEVQLVRLAALLHDIGHPPLSHSTETVLKDMYHKEGGHEAYSNRIIMYSDIKDIMTSSGLDPHAVADIVTGKYRSTLITQILHSELNADRMDYLLRDSLFCGVKYGVFDIDRLMISLRGKDGRLAVHEKGDLALLGYVLARFYMFTQVYTHRIRRSGDIMVETLFKGLLEETDEYPRATKLVPEEFVFLDDTWFLGRLRKYLSGGSSTTLKELADMFLKRRLLKVVESAEEFTETEAGKVSEKFLKLRKLKDEDMKKHLADLAHVDPERVFVDLPDRAISTYQPMTVGQGAPGEAEQIYMLTDDDKLKDPFTDPTKLYSDLLKKRLQMVRIYAYPEGRQRVSDGIGKYLEG